MVQDAVIRNFEVIGEASNNTANRHPMFAAAHPELPLASTYQMRNAVAHGYFKVDFEIVLKTIHDDLLRLHSQIREAWANINVSVPTLPDGGQGESCSDERLV